MESSSSADGVAASIGLPSNLSTMSLAGEQLERRRRTRRRRDEAMVDEARDSSASQDLLGTRRRGRAWSTHPRQRLPMRSASVELVIDQVLPVEQLGHEPDVEDVHGLSGVVASAPARAL